MTRMTQHHRSDHPRRGGSVALCLAAVLALLAAGCADSEPPAVPEPAAAEPQQATTTQPQQATTTQPRQGLEWADPTTTTTSVPEAEQGSKQPPDEAADEFHHLHPEDTEPSEAAAGSVDAETAAVPADGDATQPSTESAPPTTTPPATTSAPPATTAPLPEPPTSTQPPVEPEPVATTTPPASTTAPPATTPPATTSAPPTTTTTAPEPPTTTAPLPEVVRVVWFGFEDEANEVYCPNTEPGFVECSELVELGVGFDLRSRTSPDRESRVLSIEPKGPKGPHRVMWVCRLTPDFHLDGSSAWRLYRWTAYSDLDPGTDLYSIQRGNMGNHHGPC